MSFRVPYTRCPICNREEKYTLMPGFVPICKDNCTGKKG